MDKIKDFFKQSQVWGFFVSVVVMAVISLAFFYPDAFEGNTLRQADMQQGAANGQEALLWEQQTGEKALWTNSLFSGMPTFQISPSYPSNSLFTWLNDVYGLWLPAPANLLFMMMFGFLILLYALKMRWYYALIGAVAWGFSSYFIIIIGAGHIWKFLALTYIPPTIAGIILLYRNRYLSGAAMTALFAMLQLNANHPQMTYYFGFVIVAIAVAYLVEAVRNKTVRHWAVASVIAIGAGALALGANLPSLYNTYEYAKETKRSQSELTPINQPDEDVQANASRPTGGLPREQIVGWSYGRSEMFSLLVPNIKGGATARPEKGQQTYMSLDRLEGASEYAGTPGAALLPYLSQYFNDSEGTNGPVYVGIIIFALFLLGCIIVKGPLKWALLVSTVLSLLLALGANFATLTDFMIYNFPLYNKFRAVESILVIAEFTMPLLAILGLHKLFTTENALTTYMKPLAVSFGVPAVVCLAAALAPGMFGEAITSGDIAASENIQGQLYQMAQSQGASRQDIDNALYYYSLNNPANIDAITTLRHGMVKADGWRSLAFLALAAGVIFLFLRRRISVAIAAGAVGVLVFSDLYTADKRYVSHDSFCTPEATAAEIFTPDAIDNSILQDTAASYRVLDIPGFGSANRSYFHKMIGGYHAAKLNRYEDLIQRQLTPALSYGYMPEVRNDSIIAMYSPEEQAVLNRLAASYRVLDMLNTKYIITGDPKAPLVQNTRALGNAWLVDKLTFTDGADAEMAALSSINPADEAVADRSFAGILPAELPSAAPGDTIYMTYYSPNTLKYHAATAAGGLGVFSEVYFPWGWHAEIDGEEVPMARVNYILRALPIPAGSHEITMTFAPASIGITVNIAYACVTLIYLLLLAAIAFRFRKDV